MTGQTHQKCRHRRTFLLCSPETSRQVTFPVHGNFFSTAGRLSQFPCQPEGLILQMLNIIPSFNKMRHRCGKCIRCSGRRCIAGHDGWHG
ncbi:Rieske 2Fe-2S domain-containing protein [Escherichia coli]|uniref:Rieske 2Fe-2S domain-containing protein n=1 Tax=Escherichia coli TaxID=562 RepID=UPI0039C65602